MFLYLNRHNGRLVERWLNRENPSEPVSLVAAKNQRSAAEAVQKQHPRINAVIGLHEARPAQDTTIVVPLTLHQVPLLYAPPKRLPDLIPHISELQHLMQAGFRHITLYTPDGTVPLNIPWSLRDFHQRHAGQRCFIIGNGPSLNLIDMAKLQNEITFGANHCYLGFDRWGFTPTYWGVSDHLQIEACHPLFQQQLPENIVKFFPFQYLPLLDWPNACPVWLDWPRKGNREFSSAPERLSVGYSVVYMLMQIAAVMGCNPIILVGVDHRYSLKRVFPATRPLRYAARWVTRHGDHLSAFQMLRRTGLACAARWRAYSTGTERIWQVQDSTEPTHFDPRYTEDKQFLRPRPRDAEKDYACAEQWARQHHVTILNATPETALDIFNKVSFDTLFKCPGSENDA